MIEDCEEVYVLTSSRWIPHDSAYVHNETQMLDWQGELVEPKDRKTIDLNKMEEDAGISADCCIGYVESQQVINLLERLVYRYQAVPFIRAHNKGWKRQNYLH